MRNKILLLVLLCAASILAQSQSYSISGKVIDTLNKKDLQHAVVSLIRTSDSILLHYTRASADGSFKINNVSNGKYIVTVSYPKYTEYADIVDVNSAEVNLGKIVIIAKASLLSEIVVKQKIAAIRVKGDTTEYKADSFKVGANANVQDLLKKLPGISVNGKGEITAQGQTVKKVLVDGEEFFSDDPAVVTTSLRADVIDKVQVYDKKSDQAVFTGIDDGDKAKTINLQLKDDKKKGYFGRLEAGSDFDKFYYGKALANVFKGKQKIAAYVTTDNTRYESLNWDERNTYGEDLNRTTTVTDDGGIMSSWSGDDNFSWGQGFPLSVTGGLHFSNKWKENKHNLNNTYQYNNLAVNGGEVTTTQTLLADSTYNAGSSSQSFNNNKNRHKIRSTYEWNIDSTSSLKTIITGSISESNTSNTTVGSEQSTAKALINENERTTNYADKTNALSGNIFWRKRLKKKGRTISINTDLSFTDRINNGNLFATNTFYKSGFANTERTDQFKTNSENKSGISTKVVYTEPLWKNTFLELNYKFDNNKNNSERTTYEKPTGGTNYSVTIDSLSNHFIFNNTANTGGANFKFQSKKVNFSVGSGYGTVIYRLEDVKLANNRDITFNNFLPSASFNYTPKKQTRFAINYNGRTNNPSLSQIQPLIDNSNPLNISIGNSNLKQEFQHTIGINFSKYQVIKSQNIYASMNITFTDNDITSSNTYDRTTGKNINQYVNVNGSYNYWMWSSYGFEIAESFNLDFGFNSSGSKNINFVNGLKNETNSNRYGFSIGSGYWRDKWLNYWFRVGPSYNISSSTINPTKTKFWDFGVDADVNMKFKKQKLYFDFETNIEIYGKTEQFSNNVNVYKINVGVKKSLDKAENFQARFFVNDIFNSNADVRRNTYSNYISQTTQQVIRRYFMLSLIYNFNKNGKGNNN